MSKAHPTPWKVNYWYGPEARERHFDFFTPILDANEKAVLSVDDDIDEETVVEIVEAVNAKAEGRGRGGAE